MSEYVSMPVRRLKALNNQEELASSKGGNDTRVKLFSSEEMIERMLLKKRAQNHVDKEDPAFAEETRRRREYQQHLLMLRDGSVDDENDFQKDDMQDWLQSLHIKTQDIIDKCKPRSHRPVAATHVAAAAARLKGKKLKNQEARNYGADNLMAASTAGRSSDKSSSSETHHTQAVKEPEPRKTDDSKPNRERSTMLHAIASSSKQSGTHKREGDAKHHSESKSRVQRQKAQTGSGGEL